MGATFVFGKIPTPEEMTEYEARAVRELGPECARWLAIGEGL